MSKHQINIFSEVRESFTMAIGAIAAHKLRSSLTLLGVLVGCLLVGLLVGHWISQSGTPTGPQVVKIEGLSAPASVPTAAVPSAVAASSGAVKSSQSTHTSAKTDAAKEAKEVEEVKTAKPLPAAHKAPANTLRKIARTTGKQHEREINQLVNSDKPIETGG